MNPNDVVRRQILQWFYDRNTSASSQYGKKGSAVKISDVKSGLKAAHGLKQQQVMSNLTYLIDKGWINKSEIEKQVRTKTGTTMPSTVTWYEISAAGIDKIEGESEFQLNPKYTGINITADGSNVITVGDGNIVNAHYTKLDAALSELKTKAAASKKLDEQQKLDVVVDIETIRDQLAKAEPDKTIVGHLLSRIQDVATLGGFVSAVNQVVPLIASILPM